LNVIIPAAGIGKRMKSRGPKGLLSVHHGMSILELQVRNVLKVYPHADIIIVGGFECQKIRVALWGNFPVRIVCNHNYETTNVTHSVATGINAMLPGPLLILHGDLVFNQATIQGLAGEHSSLFVAGNQLEPTEVGIGQQDGVITALSYALPTKWGQMVYLRDTELALFLSAAWNDRLSSQWFLYEAINHVIGKGGQFRAHQPTNAKVVEVDRYSDLTKAKLI
jgi:choline kinase